MIVLQYLLISLFQIALAQFPDHIDLKQVGEIIFNNEKYNVLKPTVHKITDHFKDFMLRSEYINKNEKIFIDDNGFRHFWSGTGRKRYNLRKTDISLYEINKNLHEVNEAVPENTTLNDKDTNDQVEDTTEVIQKVKRKPIRPKTSQELDEEEKNNRETERMLRVATGGKKASGKTVAITSFFCPFFGVIKMAAFID